MDAAWITAIVSVATAVAGWWAWAHAKAEARRATQNQAITVTVDAAENVVSLVNAQLERSAKAIDDLEDRVDALEKKNFILTMAQGKMKRRIAQLETYIHDLGFIPPLPEEDLDF